MDRRAGGLRPPCIVWRRESGEICAPLPFDKESLVFFPQILWYVYFAAGRLSVWAPDADEAQGTFGDFRDEVNEDQDYQRDVHSGRRQRPSLAVSRLRPVFWRHVGHALGRFAGGVTSWVFVEVDVHGFFWRGVAGRRSVRRKWTGAGRFGLVSGAWVGGGRRRVAGGPLEGLVSSWHKCADPIRAQNRSFWRNCATIWHKCAGFIWRKCDI